jgi:TatD DNase family protein
MYDFHLHLARLSDPESIADELERRGYHYVDVGCEPWEWEKVRDLKRAEVNAAEKCAEVNRAAYGIHPMIAEKVTEEDFTTLRKFLESDSTAQVGEAGLDRRFSGYESGGAQEKVFRRQAELALELGRDIQIPCVGDYMRIVKVLREAGFKTGAAQNNAPQNNAPRPIFHRFGGDMAAVRAGIELGAIFSLHADSFRKKSTAAAIPGIPRDCVRFETDADESYGPTTEIAEALIKDLGEVKRLYELAIKGA